MIRDGRNDKIPRHLESDEAVFPEEAPMARMQIDCRQMPSEKNCTVSIAADSERELLDAAAQHAAAVHGHKDTPELRTQLKKMLKPQHA
jgi:predicted small metal-binding protein